MALDESKEGMNKLENNGVVMYIDPELEKALAKMGAIKVDYIVPDHGPAGYRITVGPGRNCGDCSC